MAAPTFPATEAAIARQARFAFTASDANRLALRAKGARRLAEINFAQAADRAAIVARHQAEDDARLDGLCGAGFAAAVRNLNWSR